MKTTKKSTKKPAANGKLVLTPERERALLECYRVIYRAELLTEGMDLRGQDDLFDMRLAIGEMLADHDGRLDEFRELGRAAREVPS